MREFKYGVGVIAPNFLLNLLLVKMSEKSLTKADFRSKNQKDQSDDGSLFNIRRVSKRELFQQLLAKTHRTRILGLTSI